MESELPQFISPSFLRYPLTDQPRVKTWVSFVLTTPAGSRAWTRGFAVERANHYTTEDNYNKDNYRLPLIAEFIVPATIFERHGQDVSSVI